MKNWTRILSKSFSMQNNEKKINYTDFRHSKSYASFVNWINSNTCTKFNSNARTDNVIFPIWDNKNGTISFRLHADDILKNISFSSWQNTMKSEGFSVICMRVSNSRIYGYIRFTEILLVYIKRIIMNINTDTKGNRKLFLKGFREMGQSLSV